MRVTLLDTGLGNLHSVERALRTAGAKDVAVVTDADAVRRAEALVVPGQGAFRDGSRALAGGLGEAIAERVRAGAPYLGICLGMQLLFPSSDEAPGCAGLGLLGGRVRRLAPSAPDAKVPHTGWNTVEPRGESILPREPAWFYFVHSFVVVPDDESVVCGTTEHGGDRFASAVRLGDVFACQFHPEKSQIEGLRLLSRWLGRIA